MTMWMIKYNLTNKGVLNLEVVDEEQLIELYSKQDKIQIVIDADGKIKEYIYIDETGVQDVEEVLKALQVKNNKENTKYSDELRQLYLEKEFLKKVNNEKELEKLEKVIEVNKEVRKQITVYKKHIENLLNSI